MKEQALKYNESNPALIKMRSLFVCILVFVGTHQLVCLDEIGQCVSLIEQVAEGYLGCFKDIENTMLPSKTVKSIPDLTLKKCQQQCQGYTFLGLQCHFKMLVMVKSKLMETLNDKNFFRRF
ncbi:hypothetical protein AM593_09670, partial [Mytilus galloprovincialis]